MNYELLKKYSYIMWSTPDDSIDPEVLLTDCASGKYTNQEFLDFIEAGSLTPKFLTSKLDDLCGTYVFNTQPVTPEDESLINLLFDWEESK